MSRPTMLDCYVGLLVATALPVLAGVLLAAPWTAAFSDPVVIAVLAAMVILGELRPIMISHGDDSVDIVTISCCFSLALVLHGPLARRARRPDRRAGGGRHPMPGAHRR